MSGYRDRGISEEDLLQWYRLTSIGLLEKLDKHVSFSIFKCYLRPRNIDDHDVLEMEDNENRVQVTTSSRRAMKVTTTTFWIPVPQMPCSRSLLVTYLFLYVDAFRLANAAEGYCGFAN